MALAAQDKKQIIDEYRAGESDTGSPGVQVAILTRRINDLTDHMKTHKKDFASRRGLLKMVSKRAHLLKYLMNRDREAYQALIGRLGLRK